MLTFVQLVRRNRAGGLHLIRTSLVSLMAVKFHRAKSPKARIILCSLLDLFCIFCNIFSFMWTFLFFSESFYCLTGAVVKQ